MSAFGSRRNQATVAGGSSPTIDPDIAWYLLDEGTGTTANDSSGNGLHAQILSDNGGTADWTTWSDGSDALEFNNPSTSNAAHIVIPDSSAIHSMRSISAWIRVYSFPTGQNEINSVAGKGYDGSKEEWSFAFYRTGTGVTSFVFRTYAAAGGNRGIDFITDWADWGTDADIHIVGVRGESIWSLYKDGQLVDTSSASTVLNTNAVPIIIGSTSINGAVSRPYDGVMKDYRLYSDELTAGDVSALYAAGPQG